MLSKIENESLFNKYSLFVLLIIYISLHLFFIDFEQIWDGRDYLNALLNATKTPLAVGGYNAYGHPSIAYFFYLSIGQHINFGSQYLLNFQNILLGCLGIFYFFKTSQFFFNSTQSFFAALLFTLSPLGFSVSIQLNLDFALMIFFAGLIYSLLYKRRILFAVNALGLCFSKEPGIFLFVTLILFAFLFFRNEFISTIRKNKISVALFLIVGIILFYLIIFKNSNSIGWGSFHFGFTKFNFQSLINFTYTILSQFFILNYNWIFSVIIISSLTFQKLKPEFISDKFNTKYLKIVLGIIGAYLLLNLIYPLFISAGIFTNPRYSAATIPVFYIVSIYCFLMFRISEKIKYIAMIGIGILLSTQLFFTTDPISKAVYGTFKFGNHEMLKMTSITNECCGIGGRDQLVYNTQFTNINTLIKKVSQEFSSDKNIPYVISDDGNFYIFSETDRKIIDVKNIIGMNNTAMPEKAIYINLPWMQEKNTDLALLQKYFSIMPYKTISENGYSIECFLIKKAGYQFPL